MAKDVKIEIVGDASKYKAALADASTASDKFSGQTKKNGDDMAKFGLGALAVGGAIGVGLFKAGEAASDLGESVNAVKVTFGESAEGILKLGEDAATAVGLSNTAFNGLAVQFSSFATTIAGKGGDVAGTIEEMTGRAADFASVMNIDVAEAAAMFQSGLAGETEPLKKFGIDLSAAAVEAYAAANGIGTLGEQLTESEKVTARYGLLMESTAKTQGDFANTADSAANASRIAKAEFTNAAASLGEVVAPVMAEVASKAAMLAKGFVSLNEATGGVLIGFTAFAGGAAILIGAVTSIVGRVRNLQIALAKIGPTATSAAAGVGVLAGVALVGLSLHGKAAADRANDVAKSIDNITRATSDRAAVEAFFQMMADNVLTGDDPFKKLAESAPEAAKRILDIGAAAGVAAPTLDKLRIAVENEDAAVAAGIATQEKYGGALDGTGNALRDQEASWDTHAKSLEDVTAATAETDRETRNLARGFETVVPAIEKTTHRVDDLAESIAGVDLAYRGLTDKLDEEEAWENVNTAIEEFGKGTKATAEELRGITRDIADYVVHTDTIPAEKKTEILALLDQGKLDEAKALLAEVTKNRTIYLDLIARGSGDIIAKLGAVGASATGGRIPMSEGMTLVGEQGPELISAPGAMVHTAKKTAAMLGGDGGGGVTVQSLTIMVNSMPTPNELMAILGKFKQRNGPAALNKLST